MKRISCEKKNREPDLPGVPAFGQNGQPGLCRCMQLTPLRGTAIAYRRSMGCPAGVYGMSAAERRPAEQCGIVRWRTHDAQRVGPIR
jgi:hypothetical protein